MADRMLDKIAALLRKAERTDNEHEADAFFRAAQALATRNSVDLALARQHTAKREKREQPEVRYITIGERGKKNLKHLVWLFLYIAQNNDVKINVASNSTYVVAFGMPSDIDVVETMYASLAVQMVEAANAFIKTGEYKKEIETVYRHGVWVDKPVDGRVARATFYEAFSRRISRRLKEAREETIATMQGEDGGAGTDLVLRNKALEVADFYQQHSTARGHWGAGSSSGYSEAGNRAGDAAGARARMGSNVAIGGSGRALTR